MWFSCNVIYMDSYTPYMFLADFANKGFENRKCLVAVSNTP